MSIWQACDIQPNLMGSLHCQSAIPPRVPVGVPVERLESPHMWQISPSEQVSQWEGWRVWNWAGWGGVKSTWVFLFVFAAGGCTREGIGAAWVVGGYSEYIEMNGLIFSEWGRHKKEGFKGCGKGFLQEEQSLDFFFCTSQGESVKRQLPPLPHTHLHHLPFFCEFLSRKSLTCNSTHFSKWIWRDLKFCSRWVVTDTRWLVRLVLLAHDSNLGWGLSDLCTSLTSSKGALWCPKVHPSFVSIMVWSLSLYPLSLYPLCVLAS